MKNNTMNTDIISHIRRDDTDQTVFCQSNREHSMGVANLAKLFAGHSVWEVGAML